MVTRTRMLAMGRENWKDSGNILQAKATKLGDGLGWDANEKICKYIKNACYVLDLSKTHKT